MIDGRPCESTRYDRRVAGARRHLHLVSSPEVFDEGLSQPITQIDLGDTETGDDDLVLLSAFTSLEWLCLEDTRVSDAGLDHLVKLRSLKHVEFTGSNVTTTGIARLKQELPNCEVVN